jgi:hypothetical protein
MTRIRLTGALALAVSALTVRVSVGLEMQIVSETYHVHAYAATATSGLTHELILSRPPAYGEILKNWTGGAGDPSYFDDEGPHTLHCWSQADRSGDGFAATAQGYYNDYANGSAYASIEVEFTLVGPEDHLIVEPAGDACLLGCATATLTDYTTGSTWTPLNYNYGHPEPSESVAIPVDPTHVYGLSVVTHSNIACGCQAYAVVSFLNTTIMSPGVTDGVAEHVEDTIFIENWVDGFASNQLGEFGYSEAMGNLNGIDDKDVLYELKSGVWNASKIISVVPGDTSDQWHELARDFRPTDAEDVLLELSIDTRSGYDPRMEAANELRFSFRTANPVLEGKPLTIQRYDPLDPTSHWPVWDIRSVIAEREGKIILEDVVDPQDDVPYSYWLLSTSRLVADVNGDGIVDDADRALIEADLGREGILRTDIADGNGVLGLPDGIVDDGDLTAFDALAKSEQQK